ncbi:hypothetical protein PAXRUDRAFT_173604, partial [Paxillus rubicundulus Ve08.2h10]
VICNVCITVPFKSCSLVRGSDVDFTCPICHKAADRDNSGQIGQAFSQYWGFTFHTSSKPVLTTFLVMSSCIVMTAGSQVNCGPLLIIHFYLKGMDLQGCPPQAICEYLWPYFPCNSLHFWESEFDFGTRAKISISEHRGKMETMQEGIGSVPSGQVMIFISTHSEEEHGDLFASEEGPQTKPRPVAVKVDHISFQIGMDHLLQGATAVLLTCGWPVKHEQSFLELHSSLHQ